MPPRRHNQFRRSETSILFTTTSKRHQRKVMTRYALWGLLCCVSLTAVGVGTHYAVDSFMRHALFENPTYALKRIDVDARGGLQRKQVLQAAGLRLGQNVMTLDLQQIEKNVERLPYVAEAQVQRQLPDRVSIRVTERLPIARIASRRTDLNMMEVLYLDRDGVAIKPQPNEPLRLNLPEIAGGPFNDVEPGQRFDAQNSPETAAAIFLLGQMELTPLRAQFDIAVLDVSHPLAIAMKTRDGVVVMFQLDYIPQQLERLQEILDFADSRARQLASVDLTPERNVPVRLR